MATLATNVLTLADWAKRLDPEGKVPSIVELLGQTNEILDDMLFMEGNLPTGHRTNVRTGLPQIFWRIINKGVASSKSTTAQIDEACGKMEAWSSLDEVLAELNGNTAEFRLSEAQAFIEAMNQEMASTLFYGNSSVDPEEFTGFAPRYSDLSAESGANIIDMGGTGADNMSIYLVCWGAQSCHGIFPKGSKAGLQHIDHGKIVTNLQDELGTRKLVAYEDQWKWDVGIALKDWRYVVRIANIDVPALVANAGAQADLINGMIKATKLLPSLNMGRCAFYMNRTAETFLDIQRRDDVAAAGMVYKEVDGKEVPTFRNIPIRKCDALLETEEQVV